jgi:hypothetical protein
MFDSRAGRHHRSKEFEDNPREVSLQASQRFPTALALGLLAGQERPRRRMHPRLSDGDPMEGEVELAVALAVEAVAPLAQTASRPRIFSLSGQSPTGTTATFGSASSYKAALSRRANASDD